MGHEIAHAVARHGNERMSQGLLVQVGGIALSVALSQKTQMTQDIFLQSYGITSQLGMLKYSRTHESEADKMGLVFMAIAGYDPSEAVAFWERMEKTSAGNKPPEILSTHPSDATRIGDIKAFLPEAMKYYKKK
jgi:predicted Zn-dependent protease